jgi:heptosyltransferase-2
MPNLPSNVRTDVPLVIQPLPGIGDMIWHLPHIHAIAAAHPNGQVDILTKRRSLADRLLATDPAVAEIVWLERDSGQHAGVGGMLRLARELRERRYRQCWILHGSTRYALTAWLAGIPQRIGFGAGAQRWWLQRSTNLPSSHHHQHPIDKANALLQRAGISMAESEPSLVLDPTLVEQVQATYADCPQPWIALGIGSSEPDKQWGADKFAELANKLLARGASCLLIGGPAEASLAQQIVNRIDGNLYPNRLHAVTASPIDAVAALLSHCSHYVGNDTGVLNMAAAVGVTCTGLFGGSMPLRHSSLIHCVEADFFVVMDRSGPGMYADGATGMASISVEKVLRAMDDT